MPIDKVIQPSAGDLQTLEQLFSREVRAPVEILMRNGLYKEGVAKGDIKLTIKDLESLTDSLNRIMESFNIYARFNVHAVTKDIWVRIINANTKEVIREVPPKKILDMVAKFMEMLGMLIDEKA